MYDRAPRQLTVGADGTDKAVGPGTYDAATTSPAKVRAGRLLAIKIDHAI